ncbi:MAG: SufD family Fe-S cluster assembly protein [Megasphaera sp.]|jgi:Fe-S cluster assembly scaffold protein SufB|nr:SufD family Fe-S cluster assembly protein [Megasphaera sp.]MCI1248828.1 SufD family Fe-S cluster assembly protein [Megasphaera sp.]
MDAYQKHLLEVIADLHGIPEGAYNIRSNGKAVGRASTAHIEIEPQKDRPGINIYIKPETQHEAVHIPVILSQAGLKDMVYNDFYVGEGADVVIVAGCGIHCGDAVGEQHDGIHTFHIEKNAHVKYIEKHYGEGDGSGQRIMNPQTIVHMAEGSYMEMETTQIKGIDQTKRWTEADVAADATFIVHEKLMTYKQQECESGFEVRLNGDDSSANVISRAVAREKSHQVFRAKIVGNARCHGHSSCDSIIMDDAKISAIPELTANNTDAALIHEAAIGKIAGEQLTKLMTLGLTAEEAEAMIIQGFLK